MKHIFNKRVKRLFFFEWRIKSASILLLWGLLNCVSIQAEVYSLKDPLMLKLSNVTVEQAVKEVSRISGYKFMYNNEEVNLDRLVSIDVENASIEKLAKQIFPDHTILIRGKNVVVTAPQEAVEGKKAKKRSITGRVTDVKGEMLIGVTVQEIGTENGTITDESGTYIIRIGAGQRKLKFSYIGFLDKIMDVGQTNILDVILMEDLKEIDEVVVVGFGKQKKQSLVGAVQTIKPSELKTTSSSFTSSFAGKLAGMISVQKSGEPGSDGANFWIRGVSSFSKNLTPLIILDGVEVDSYVLNSIPPETIDQFSLLKDATATSLYGTRGANGVLIVTTKSGKNMERMNVNVRVESRVATHTSRPEVVDGVTYMKMFNEAIKTRTPSGTTYLPKFSQDKIDGTAQNLNPYIYPNVDWYSALFKDFAHHQNANVSIIGGGTKLNYFVNAAFFNESGFYKDFDKYKGNITHRKYLLQSNITAVVTKSTTLTLKLNAIFRDRGGASQTPAELYYASYTTPPTDFPPFFPALNNEEYTLFGTAVSPHKVGYYTNPYVRLAEAYTDSFSTTTLGVLDLTQDLSFLLKGLKIKSLVSFNTHASNSVTRRFIPHYFTLKTWTQSTDGSYEYELESMGEAGRTTLSTEGQNSGSRRFNIQASIDYVRTFAERHDVSALLLYHQKQYNNSTGKTLLDLLPLREQGLAGRFTYGFDNRYLMEFNFGYNGSENFKKGNRFGLFPSVAVGYIISNEKYFQALNLPLNLLKIRASYGLVGNDKIDQRFPYLSSIQLDKNSYLFGYDFDNSLAGPRILLLGNSKAQWEVGKKTNLGIELGLFNSLTIIADFFRENRENIFMNRRINPAHLGTATMSPYANLGKVQNNGVDVSLEYNKALNKDLLVSVRGTFTYAYNILIDKDEPPLQEPYQSEIGKPLNVMNGLVALGLFESEEEVADSPIQTFSSSYGVGDIKYKDLNNDGKIDGNDVQQMGKPTIPQIIYGFGTSVQYKKFDFSLFFQGTGKVSLRVWGDTHPFGKNNYNVMKFVADDYWSEDNPNPNAKYPRLDYRENVNNRKLSTFWLRDAAFLRLKNAEIGYSHKLFRIYVAGDNLLTFSKFKLWDPEIGVGAGLSYPLQSTVRAGIQFNFN